MKVDNKVSILKRWKFSEIKPKDFDAHISKSIPMFKDLHWLVLQISNFFIHEDSNIYDLGCSTGELLSDLNKFLNYKSVKYYGIDIEKSMISYANKKHKRKNLKYICADILKYPIKKNDLSISFFTLQFIKQKFRQIMLNKIYNNLNFGGAFIFAEKVRSYDARTQEMNNEIYRNWKLKNGFTMTQINNKQQSLIGYLDPFSSKGNLDLLKRAGFKDLSTVAKFVNFEVFLAIK